MSMRVAQYQFPIILNIDDIGIYLQKHNAVRNECDGDNNKKNPIDRTWQSGEGKRTETESGNKKNQLN